MTIAERKAREAYDRENPWLSISTAKPSAMICELRGSYFGGPVDHGNARFFLSESGDWYQIEPAGRVYGGRLMECRPTGITLGPDRQRSVNRPTTLTYR